MSQLAVMLLSARPWSFFLSLASITTGSVVAFDQGIFHLDRYLLVILGSVVAHAGMNLLNDYFDFKHGVDDASVATSQYRPHPLVEGKMTPAQILTGAGACYAVALSIGVYMAAVAGWSLVLVVFGGAFVSYFYTAEPINFKRRALGELAMFLATGPLMVSGAYFVQTGSWENVGPVVLISIPVGMWWSLILSANNLKDIETDRHTLGKTVATILGRRGGVMFFGAIAAVVYLGTLVDVLLGVMPIWAIAVFVTLPRIVQLMRIFLTADTVPANADPMTAQVEIVYSALLVAAFLVNRFVPQNVSF
ncbi:MAG TPA: prenyltransferase [Spirochaetia bacterium]|nr:prenyltransferase [Spirochaetia bacterium]